MARDIDMSDPSKWSEEDIAYLRDRGRLPEGFEDPSAAEAADKPSKAEKGGSKAGKTPSGGEG